MAALLIRLKDRQIWQVGAGVDRLKDIAITIGEKAREQEEATVRLSRQADEANEQVIEVNAKLKSLMVRIHPYVANNLWMD